MSNKETIDLSYQECDEGFILLAETGKVYRNQTGGVMCHHPEAEGVFVPRILPDAIKGMMCCRSVSEDDETLLADLNTAFALSSIPFVVLEGEEAWLRGIYAGFDAIATWENCD